jgi:hypothetical protein
MVRNALPYLAMGIDAADDAMSHEEVSAINRSRDQNTQNTSTVRCFRGVLDLAYPEVRARIS